MLYSAKFMFENNITEIYRQVGEPESAKRFYKNYITPALEKDSNSEIEADYGDVKGDCQFDGFVLGFNTAVKFIMGCVMEKGLNI